MPARRIYIPYFIALTLAFLTVFIASVFSECNWYGTCDRVFFVWVIVLVVLVMTVLSFFIFRKVIIVANATLIIVWNLRLIIPVDISHGSIVLSILIFLPSIALAGLAIKRCFKPSLESPWQKWRVGK
jgi:hypothetical protein